MFFKLLAKVLGFKQDEVPKSSPEKPNGKYQDYSVQHLKEAGIYVTLYRGEYLKEAWPSYLVSPCSGIVYAQQFRTEERAWSFIDKHIDQQGRETTSFITR